MTWEVLEGDCRELLRTLPAESVQCVVTSPPYWGLRDYGLEPTIWDGEDGCDHEWGDPQVGSSMSGGQATGVVGSHQDDRTHFVSRFAVCLRCNAWRGSLGLEPTPDLYVEHIVQVFQEVRRVLRKDGTVWLNMGDSYASGMRSAYADDRKYGSARASDHRPPTPAGVKPKDLIGIPWTAAFALRADGWYLRSCIVWSKPNPMPESVTDRPTTAHEFVFLLTQQARYFYDADAVREPPAIPNRKAGSGRRDYPSQVGGHQPGNTVDRGDYLSPPEAGRNLRSVWNIPTEPFSDWTPTVRRVPVPLDEIDDDTKRTTSPSCPEHGGQTDPVSSGGDGGRGADALSHTGRTDAHPAQELPSDSVPTETIPGRDSVSDSSGLILPAGSQTATLRSKGTRKRVSQSVEDGSDDGGSPPRTGYSGPLGAPLEPDDSDNLAKSETTDRTVHTSCTCEYYSEITDKTSHFATFPKKLVEPCVKAGSRGLGRRCDCDVEILTPLGNGEITDPSMVTGRAGFNRPRRPDEGTRPITRREQRDYAEQMRQSPHRGDMEVEAGPAFAHYIRTDQSGARPLPPELLHRWLEREWLMPPGPCRHPEEPGDTVLDPFCGSGTVGIVARGHGRSFIGIELSETYADMARRRISGTKRGLDEDGTPLWEQETMFS